MIQSMTGYGAAEHVEDGVSHALELRSVNNRYLKLVIKLPEPLQFTETSVDKLVRGRIARGTVTCILRTRTEGAAGVGSLNAAAMQHYLDQMARVRVPDGVHATVDLAIVAGLPGVCQSPESDEATKKHQLEVVERLYERALDALIEMRRREGLALRSDFLGCCDTVRKLLAGISVRAPMVIDGYRERLRSRVETLMRAGGFELEADALAREVAVFAERCDIGEELTRLDAHLNQFAELCDRDEPVGRTMDFLAQELLREANTVASKSNDGETARLVIEIKGQIDRLKEQVQNVE